MLQKVCYIIIVYFLYAVQTGAQLHDNKHKSVTKTIDSSKDPAKKTKAKNSDSNKNKIVRLRISVVDDSTKTPLNAAVTIAPVDSVNTVMPAIAKAEDTANLFYALLSRDKSYMLTVNNSLYAIYNRKLHISNDSFEAVGLKRITDTAEIDDKKTPVTNAGNPPDTSTLENFIRDHTSSFISICVLFSLALVGILVYIIRRFEGNAQSKKEHAAGVNADAGSEENLKTKDVMIDTVIGNETAESSPGEIEKEQPETLITEQIKSPDTAAAARNFICEIMMTAGPRKKFMSEADADKDLGEDVCGFVSDTKKVLLWMLDGTSDLHCLKNPADNREYFSSRLLAQLFAEKIRNCFSEKEERGLDDLVSEVIAEVKEDFLERIEKLPDDEKFFLKKNIANKNFPECATTVLIARLSLNGDFTAYRSGDSKMFLFSLSPEKETNLLETSLGIKNEQSNDRLFFRLVLDVNDKFSIFFNQLNSEIVTKKNINTIICFSDGIGINTELSLRDEYRKNPKQIRKEIMYQLQGTGDDKSICFVEIKEI